MAVNFLLMCEALGCERLPGGGHALKAHGGECGEVECVFSR
jgi:hypothetical protein